MVKTRILVIDDDMTILNLLAVALNKDFEIYPASTSESAREQFKAIEPNLVLIDIHLNEKESQGKEGIELLKAFLWANPELPVVMISAEKATQTVVECMRLGALDFIVKPFSLGVLRERLLRVLRESKTFRRAVHLEQRLAQILPANLIGNSLPMQEIKGQISAVAMDAMTSVLIRGEPGTGKELVAQAIHRQGRRCNEAMVTVNVAALAPGLLEAELFGYEKGAFTGANRRHIGYLEKADGGVLFLDEIGELNRAIQVKLLRFLQERTLYRLGNTHEIEVDVQLVMATNRDLEKMLAQNDIYQDFYYRIKQFEIHLPPLQNRRDDIPLLVEHFLQNFRNQGRSKISEVASAAMNVLICYHWPGNVRELETVIGRAIIYASYHGHQRIEQDDMSLDRVVCQPKTVGLDRADIDGIDLDNALARCELQYIEQALAINEGRKIQAAIWLNLNDRFALHRRVKRLQRDYRKLIADFPMIQKLYKK